MNAKPFIIAGPCSAETEKQVLDTAKELSKLEVSVFRAGVWKPRTKPGNFEGAGTKSLVWLKRVQQEFGMKTAVEVANPQHVALALNAGVDVLWIGARTTTNPFAVQEIADALQGCDVPILVKNPVTPDVGLWLGAVERLQNAGIQHITAVHRGFDTGDAIYRNNPQWHVPIEFRRRVPEILMLCDPSHIAGQKSLVAKVAQQAMQLNFNGLMIEVHCCPSKALSDANQQITPKELAKLLKNLVVNQTNSQTEVLTQLRQRIDDLDVSLIEIIAQRMKIVQEIGHYKKQNSISVLQSNRYDEVLQQCINQAINKKLNTDFIKKIFEIIHEEAIKTQL